MLRQDIAWFDTNTTSDFASRMTEDLNKVQDGMGEKVGMMLRFIFAGLTAFIYPFIANWLLSLVLLSLVPILAIMGGIMGKVQSFKRTFTKILQLRRRPLLGPSHG